MMPKDLTPSNELFAELTDPDALYPLDHWLNLGHTLFPAQQTMMATSPTQRLDVCLYEGEPGCGKTHAAILLGIELAVCQPKSTGLVVAKYAATLRDALIPRYLDLLTKLGMVEGQEYRYQASCKRLVFVNGSEILFRPVGRSQAYKSLECQWMHAEALEELSETVFITLMEQLRQPSADGYPVQLRFFGTARPVTDGWLARYFHTPLTSAYRNVVGYTRDNTVISPAFAPHLDALREAQRSPVMETFSDNSASDNLVAVESQLDKTLTDKAQTDKTLTDKAQTDKTLTDLAPPEAVSLERWRTFIHRLTEKRLLSG